MLLNTAIILIVIWYLKILHEISTAVLSLQAYDNLSHSASKLALLVL